MDTTTDLLRKALEALTSLDDAYCTAGHDLTKQQRNEGRIAVINAREVKESIRTALSAPPAPEGAMAEIDLADDDALRFIQRVLESDAPNEDRLVARNMVVEIRTRVRKAHKQPVGTKGD